MQLCSTTHILLFILSFKTVLFREVAAQLGFCNQQCQQSQRTALQSLFSQTNGHRWQRSGGWTPLTCGSACDVWPQHCSWNGVHCCLPAGVIGSGTPQFPSNAAINCTMVGGVAALLLSNQHLHGRLSEEIWLPFQGSMKYLDLSGGSLVKVPCMQLCNMAAHMLAQA